MTTELVLHALDNAVSVQQPNPGLILHTILALNTQVKILAKRLKNRKSFLLLVAKVAPTITHVLNLFMPF